VRTAAGLRARPHSLGRFTQQLRQLGLIAQRCLEDGLHPTTLHTPLLADQAT
jgi:hypothetical protein